MTDEEKKLYMKLGEAKGKLKAQLRRHGDSCMIEMDPEYYGPCTCGASGHNASIQAAIDAIDEV